MFTHCKCPGIVALNFRPESGISYTRVCFVVNVTLHHFAYSITRKSSEGILADSALFWASFGACNFLLNYWIKHYVLVITEADGQNNGNQFITVASANRADRTHSYD